MPITLTPGVNTYASLTEADAYFSESFDAAAWTGETDPDRKAKALIAAARRIDRLMLVGKRANADQVMEFPRAIRSSGSVTDRKTFPNLYDGWLIENEVAECVKQAQCEETLKILEGKSKRMELQEQGVTSISLGPMSESYREQGTLPKLQSSTAMQLLRMYLLGNAGVR